MSKSDSILTDTPLPNPFSEADRRLDRLEQCEIQLADQERTISLLTQSVTLLMQLCNKKLTGNTTK